MKKVLFTLLVLGLFTMSSYAQADGDGWGSDSGDGWGDDSGDGWGSDDNSGSDYDYDQGSGASYTDDSTTNDDAWGSDDDSWGSSDDDNSYGYGGNDRVRAARPQVTSKPYERFTGMPYDSTSQLVAYMEIVEVIVPDRFLDLGGEDYAVYDSLYARALTWMQKEFGKKEAKQMIEAAGADPNGKEGSTINAFVTMPLLVQVNKYQTKEAGQLQFDMELRFKDERYRYKFENFMHIHPNPSGDKKDEKTYMEYYLNAKKNVRKNDVILIACNNQMNKLIEGLKATCAAVPYIDDDDW